MSEEGAIGPYRIVRRLGFGRSSEVLLATRKFPGGFERRVVIKRLLAPCEDEADRQAVLATEALAYARVAHPAIVQLFDFFSYDGRLALVLEYVDGPSLSRLQASLRAHRESLGDRVSFYIASRIFAALAAAHSARDPRTGVPTPVIHRDVSPDNVFVPWDGFVKLGDFDLAKVVGVTGETRGGLLKGTYGYMAPEQVKGEAVTPRTDVYGGCLVLRELLLARPAFDGELPELELLRAMEASRLAPVESIRGGISRRLADAMRRGLARDPAERTLTAGEMVEVLRAEGDVEAAHTELIAILARHRPSDGRGSSSQSAPTPPAGVAAQAPPAPVLGVPAVSPTPRSGTPLLTALNRGSVPKLESSRGAYDTPRTMTFASPESVPPIEGAASSIRPGAPRRRSRVVAVALVSAAALAAGYLLSAPRLLTPVASGAATALAEDKSSPALPSSPPLVQLPPALVQLPPASVEAPAPPAVQPAGSPNPAAASASSSPRADAAPSAPIPVPTTGEIVTPFTARGHRVWVDGKVAAFSSGETLRVPCGTHVVRIGSTGESRTLLVPCGGMAIAADPRPISTPAGTFQSSGR